MPANRWRGPKRNNHTQASVPPGAGVFFMSDFVLPFSADKRRGTSGCSGCAGILVSNNTFGGCVLEQSSFRRQGSYGQRWNSIGG